MPRYSLFGLVEVHGSLHFIVRGDLEGDYLQGDETRGHGEDFGPVGGLIQVLPRVGVGHAGGVAAHDVEVGAGYHSSTAVPLHLSWEENMLIGKSGPQKMGAANILSTNFHETESGEGEAWKFSAAHQPSLAGFTWELFSPSSLSKYQHLNLLATKLDDLQLVNSDGFFGGAWVADFRYGSLRLFPVSCYK